MPRFTLTLPFIFGLAILSTPASLSQDVAPDSGATESGAIVAYVYAQTSKGINVYDSDSAGRLTLVKGSPFQPSGPGQAFVGSNGKFLIMVGANDLHSYPVESKGAIGKQNSQINSQSYSGWPCGIPDGAELSPNGQDIYLFLASDAGDCNAVQTYAISKTGSFSFKGDTELQEGDPLGAALPTLIGNGKFGYGVQFDGYDDGSCSVYLTYLFKPNSQGVLEYQDNISPVGKSITPPPGYGTWIIPPGQYPTSDPMIPPPFATDATDHLVVAMQGTIDGDCRDATTYGPLQLASYTANSQGILTSSNSYENMPAVIGTDDGNEHLLSNMTISPSGKVLAVAVGTGIQFFHFNGANPITKFTGIIGSSGYITAMQWDKDNHLYAINGSSGKVHVYTVTTTSVVEAAGSPYSIGATGLVVAQP